MGVCHSRSKQRTDQRVLVLTFKFLALRNWFFPRKKYFLNFFDFCLLLFYATFQWGPYNFFKKIPNYFLTHENFKKWASKVPHNRPKPFFSQSGLKFIAHSQELIFHIINMSQDSSVSLFVVLGHMVMWLLQNWPLSSSEGVLHFLLHLFSWISAHKK